MLVASHDLYRFDVFELDTFARVLKRNNAIVSLTPKDLDVLGYLALNSGRVVTKEELFQAVWPNAFVEENNLNQHISALRKALADKPGCIVTIPGRGYQFTAAVQVVHPVEALPESLPGDVFVQRVRQRTHLIIENAPTLALPGASVARRSLVLRWAVISALVGALAALVIILGVKYFAHPPQLCDVVLADFTNTTGDAAFDQTLNRALEMDLAQSPFLNLLPRSSVMETLAQMQRKPDELLTSDLAREICERNNAQAVLHGTIASFGSQYLVMLAADSCVNGKQVAGARSEAGSKEEILRALDEVAGRVRKQLGESAASLARFETPIAEATTPSLGALRAYSQAMKASDRGDIETEKALFERAIALDPNFASAYRGLSNSYYNRRDYVQAAKLIAKAYDLRARTTERERLTIETAYSAYGTYDFEAAIASMRLYSQVYPNDAANWFSLSNIYAALGEYAQAIEAGEHGYRLDPRSGIGADILARAYRKANRFADAKRVAKAAIADGRDPWGIHSTLFQIAFAEQDAAGMKAETEWGFTHQELDQSLVNLGFVAASRGKRREAIDDFTRARQEALRSGDADFADDASLWLSAILFEYGDRNGAAACLKQMKSDAADPGTMTFFQAELGDPAPAQRLIAKIENSDTKSTLGLYFDRPMLRALLALEANRPGEAVAEIEPARKFQMRDYGVPYQRARMETDAGMFDAAAADYRLILDNPGLDPIWPDLTLSHLRLARVLALKHDSSGSRSEYEKLFAAWKDADKDLLLLEQARSEYARLK
jgi:DNA-binding winged helix-turn-helix (wHTH) protein/thioredoxin-like negative regulator of GroEL